MIGGDGFGSGDGGHGGGGDGGCGLPEVLATEVCHDERVHLPQQLRLLHRLVHCFVLDFSSLRFPTLRSPKAEQLDALCGGFGCTAICDWTELLKLKKTSKTRENSYACYYTVPLQVDPG